jgi:hypothetical protein
MQQPAGVDEMKTIYTIKSIGPAFCEKKPLFRHGILLPKIELSPITLSRIGQFTTAPVSIIDQVQLKTVISCSVLTVDQCDIITNTPLKRHSPQHAA